MKDFVYKARDVQGKLLSGIISANSLQDAITILNSKSLIVIDINEAKEKKVVVKKEVVKKVKLKKSVSLLDLAVFFRQMSTMVNAGVPIFAAVLDISQVTSSAKLKKILEEVTAEIGRAHV